MLGEDETMFLREGHRFRLCSSIPRTVWLLSREELCRKDHPISTCLILKEGETCRVSSSACKRLVGEIFLPSDALASCTHKKLFIRFSFPLYLFYTDHNKMPNFNGLYASASRE